MNRTARRAPRMTLDERRQEILGAAIREFASWGLHGSSTERIARQVGISQPYVFKLFGTKKELFIASVELVCDRILAAFQDALLTEAGSPLEAMGCAYEALLSERDELLVLLHGFAGGADEDVRRSVRERYRQIVSFVRDASEASDSEVQAFFGQGMLLTVAMAIDMPEFLLTPQP